MLGGKLGFQSTPSAWRVTVQDAAATVNNGISIHTLRMEGDAGDPLHRPGDEISIHTLRMEGDFKIVFKMILPSYFNPHPPHGG